MKYKILLLVAMVSVFGCKEKATVVSATPKTYLPDSLMKRYFPDADSMYSIGDKMYYFKGGYCDTIQIMDETNFDTGEYIQSVDTITVNDTNVQ